MNGETEFNFYNGPVDERWEVLPDDLLFAWAGMRETSFGPRIWHGPNGVLNQHIFKVMPNIGLSGKRFLYLLLAFNLERIIEASHGFKDSFVHIKRSELTSVVASVPCHEEQEKIVKIVEKQDSIINREREILNKLRKIKLALMQDLLTGKVRVKADDCLNSDPSDFSDCRIQPGANPMNPMNPINPCNPSSDKGV